MDKEQVLEAINAAFPDEPIPDARAIIRHLEPRDPEGEEEIREKLTGKSWRSLTPAFLGEWWSSFCYLSSEGYRYYLPALLTCALQDFTDESDLVHSVVFDLVPSFWYLYYEGEDLNFRDQLSSLTLDQYRTVSAFLGLVFDQLPRWRHEAAQALHWGWNQIETPALTAANRYYHQMHHYTYPESKDPKIAALCHEIGTAFADTPYPGDDQLCGSSQGDEPAEYAMDFRGMNWQSAHPELLRDSYAATSFLSPAGFRYFLPAFLWADLLYSEIGIESNANPVFDLTHGFYDRNTDKFANLIAFETERQNEEGIDNEGRLDMLRRAEEREKSIDWRAISTRRFAAFTLAERIAVIHYLNISRKIHSRPVRSTKRWTATGGPP